MAPGNGVNEVPTTEEWRDLLVQMHEIKHTVNNVNQIAIPYLRKLNNLDKLSTIETAINEMRGKFLEELITAYQGSVKGQSKATMATMNVLLLLIAVLITVIGVLLLGEKFGLIRELYR